MDYKQRSLSLRLIMLVIFALLLAGCSAKKGEVKGVFVNSEGEPLSEEIKVTLQPLTTFDDGKVGWSFEYQLSDEYHQRLQELVTNDGTFLFEMTPHSRPSSLRAGIKIPAIKSVRRSPTL